MVKKIDPFAKNERIQVATQEMSLDEAIAFFEKSKQIPGLQDPIEPYLNLSQVYLLKGWMKRAENEVIEGLRIDPKSDAAKTLLDSIRLSLN